MKIKTGLTALLLAVVIAACSAAGLTACSQPADPGTESQTQKGPEADLSDNSTAETEPQFAEADYGGADFVIYMRSSKEFNYPGLYIVPDENASDVVSSEAVKRNLIVEQKYNIKFKTIEVSTPSSTIVNDINSGTPYYDVALDHRNKLGSLALSGNMTNLYNLGIDYTKPWWDENAYNSYSFSGRLYVMPNDASVSNLGGTRFYYFNKAVLEDFRLTSPYELADKNEWTLDNFVSMVKSVSVPDTGSELGVYGLVNESGSNLSHMLVGCGIPWLEVTADNELVCNVCSVYGDRTQQFIDKIKGAFEDQTVCLTFDEAHSRDAAGAAAFNDKYAHSRGLFAQDHFLFVHCNMKDGAIEFVDMPKGFGVIMNPKFDSNQKEYYHKMDSNSLIWGIPAVPGTDIERAAIIMDYWAYVSTSTVMESYYELTLKTKRASDPVAAGVLDTVKGSICYYLTDIYGSGSTVNISGMVNAAYSGSVANAEKTYSRPNTSGLTKLKQKLESLE
jgi:hypothetical protein